MWCQWWADLPLQPQRRLVALRVFALGALEPSRQRHKAKWGRFARVAPLAMGSARGAEEERLRMGSLAAIAEEVDMRRAVNMTNVERGIGATPVVTERDRPPGLLLRVGSRVEFDGGITHQGALARRIWQNGSTSVLGAVDLNAKTNHDSEGFGVVNDAANARLPLH